MHNSVSCPYCHGLAKVGKNALNCTSCGAYAVEHDKDVYEWHSKLGKPKPSTAFVGTLDRIVDNYKW